MLTSGVVEVDQGRSVIQIEAERAETHKGQKQYSHLVFSTGTGAFQVIAN